MAPLNIYNVSYYVCHDTRNQNNFKCTAFTEYTKALDYYNKNYNKSKYISCHSATFPLNLMPDSINTLLFKIIYKLG